MNKFFNILAFATIGAFSVVSGSETATIESLQAINNTQCMLSNLKNVDEINISRHTMETACIAWLIVWFGENEMQPTKELDDLFVEIEKKCKFVGTPYYICFPEKRAKFLKSLAMENLNEKSVNSGVLVSAIAANENTIGQLLQGAKQRIRDRTGYKFH